VVGVLGAIRRDVVEGWRHLVPPWFYLPMHPAAKLSEADKMPIENSAERAAR
jgi:hypothetical protein